MAAHLRVRGYLDLLARVVLGWTPERDVTMQVAGQFERALAEIAEKSERGRAFAFDGGQRLCPSWGESISWSWASAR